MSSETATATRPLAAHAGGPLEGRVRVPGDKSISHRALMLGALATGVTRLKGLLEAEDVLNTAKALQALGAPIEKVGDEWRVTGRGVGGLRQPAVPLDFGNSGTGTRLMLGVIAGHDMTVRIEGDASLSRRPMGRVLGPLQQMGLEIEGGRNRLPLIGAWVGEPRPHRIRAAGAVGAGQERYPARRPARCRRDDRHRDGGDARSHRAHAAPLRCRSVGHESGGKTRITVKGEAELRGRDVTVPADPSSAAFLAAAAALVPGSDITIEGVLVNPTRIGFYDTLREMGADVTFTGMREEGGEPVADIRVRYVGARRRASAGAPRAEHDRRISRSSPSSPLSPRVRRAWTASPSSR